MRFDIVPISRKTVKRPRIRNNEEINIFNRELSDRRVVATYVGKRGKRHGENADNNPNKKLRIIIETRPSINAIISIKNWYLDTHCSENNTRIKLFKIHNT